MKIGVLGTGRVGTTLGSGFLALGHEVRLGSRDRGNPRMLAWVAANGGRAGGGTFAEAAGFGELVVLATHGTAVESALATCCGEDLAGKVLVDTTNPLDFSHGFPPRLAFGHSDSSGERVQRMVGSGRVVKAFNTVSSVHMVWPRFPDGPPSMFICGNDPAAKTTVAALCCDLGWSVVDIGDIAAARYLEPMCLVGFLHGARSGRWNHAFKMIEC
jgi:8-hydroxy-5-deazaflavin:NADPH oxidoreductase